MNCINKCWYNWCYKYEKPDQFDTDDESDYSDPEDVPAPILCDTQLMALEFMQGHPVPERLSHADLKEFIRLYNLYHTEARLRDLPYDHGFNTTLSAYYRRAAHLVL